MLTLDLIRRERVDAVVLFEISRCRIGCVCAGASYRWVTRGRVVFAVDASRVC